MQRQAVVEDVEYPGHSMHLDAGKFNVTSTLLSLSCTAVRTRTIAQMIDNFSILLSHVLIAVAFWFLSRRDDLDREDAPAPDAEPEGFATCEPAAQP